MKPLFASAKCIVGWRRHHLQKGFVRSFLSGFAFFCIVLAADDLQGQAGSSGVALSEIESSIDSYDIRRARSLLNKMSQEQAQSPTSMYLNGKLLFFEGKHNEALAVLRDAIEKSKTEMKWKSIRDRVARSKAIFEKLKVTPGNSGEFMFFHQDGLDALLVPYADSALHRQRVVLEKKLGISFQLPIRVVILSKVEALSELSGLLVEQVEATGTVGISKYNQIMILSPGIIASGYPWLDTLAHELTHVGITIASRDKAPIWLHEGIAKLFETTWRGDEWGQLSPEEAYILDRAARERRLIPLRRFHPSVSLLPNQEDAALAYAQVLSFMLYLNNKIAQKNWVKQLLSSAAKGRQIDGELVRLTKFNLKKLYTWWEHEVTGTRQAPVSLVPIMKKKFKKGVTAGYQLEESLLSDGVRRHIRIGDLLRMRGHIKPATVEYKRALTLNKFLVPEITDRLGGCLMDLKNDKAAVKLLEPVSQLYPFHSTVFVQLGSTYMGLKKWKEAAVSLIHAVSLDPFHPQVHCMLSKLYTKLNKTAEAQLEKDHCLLLSNRSEFH